MSGAARDGKTIVLFDVDGTLTEARKVGALCSGACVGRVGAMRAPLGLRAPRSSASPNAFPSPGPARWPAIADRRRSRRRWSSSRACGSVSRLAWSGARTCRSSGSSWAREVRGGGGRAGERPPRVWRLGAPSRCIHGRVLAMLRSLGYVRLGVPGERVARVQGWRADWRGESAVVAGGRAPQGVPQLDAAAAGGRGVPREARDVHRVPNWDAEHQPHWAELFAGGAQCV